jgi:tetratricopeptide (TPR) repeat protein
MRDDLERARGVTHGDKQQLLDVLCSTGGPFDDTSGMSRLFRKLIKMDIQVQSDDYFVPTALATSLSVSVEQLAVYVTQIRKVLRAHYSGAESPPELSVSFPRGSYRPRFERHEAVTAADVKARFAIESWNGPRVWEGVIQPISRQRKQGKATIAQLSSLAAALIEAAYWGDRRSSDLCSEAIAAGREAIKKSSKNASRELACFAHFCRASVAATFEHKFAMAEKLFTEAIRLSAKNPFAHAAYATNSLSPARRLREAIAEAKLALALDSTSPFAHSALGWMYFHSENYDAALKHWNDALHFFPTAFSPRYGRACTFGEVCNWTKCFATLNELLAEWPGQPYLLALMGHYKAKSGDEKAARRVLELLAHQKKTYVSPYGLALVNAGLGKVDEVFCLLDQAAEDRDVRLTFVDITPAWRSLYKDVRYRQFCRRMRLPQFLNSCVEVGLSKVEP